VARDIIDGNGTLFAPQAVIVATWYKVEAFNGRIGPRNTFQLFMAYSETGETEAIFAYSQLEYFESPSYNVTYVDYQKSNGDVVQSFFVIDSNTTMNSLLNGTNCNRTGTFGRLLVQGRSRHATSRSSNHIPASYGLQRDRRNVAIYASSQLEHFESLPILCPL
jgi:hypothetical protein